MFCCFSCSCCFSYNLRMKQLCAEIFCWRDFFFFFLSLFSWVFINNRCTLNCFFLSLLLCMNDWLCVYVGVCVCRSECMYVCQYLLEELSFLICLVSFPIGFFFFVFVFFYFFLQNSCNCCQYKILFSVCVCLYVVYTFFRVCIALP